MKPVAVSITVPEPPRVVFDHLDVLANHASFLDHFLVDWSFSGPRSGVGARAKARQDAPGSQDWMEFEVLESEPPRRIVEEGVSAGGRRRTRGTYTLEELPSGATRVSFQLQWEKVAKAEGLIPFLTRAFVRRANGKGMRRLAEQLGG